MSGELTRYRFASGKRPSLRLAGLLNLTATERAGVDLLACRAVAQLQCIAGVLQAAGSVRGHAEAKRAIDRPLDDLLAGRAAASAPHERDVVRGDGQGRSHIAQEVHGQDDVQGRRSGADTKDDRAGRVYE